jgi:putative ABC transport system permease protein
MLPDLFGDLDQLTRLLLSAVFVVIAVGISRWQQADLERDLLIATARSFIQLILIGYALELVFSQDSVLFTAAILLVMIGIAGHTSGSRARKIPSAGRMGTLAIGIGAVLTLGTLVVLGVFAFVPRDIIPIGGMVIGNAMSVATLVMTRLYDDVHDHRLLIETRLALGATGRQASLTQFRRAVRSAMIPIIDTTKTVGLIQLPGAMTGMILAGASPLQAVQLQIIVMYMLIGAATFTGLMAAYLAYRSFFTSDHRLRLPSESSGSL